VKRPATKQTQSFVAAAEVGECLRTGGAGFVCVCVCVSVCVRCMFTLAVVSLSVKSNETLFGLFSFCLLPPARLKRTCCHIYCWSRYVYIPVALKGEAESIQLSENLYYTLGLVVSYYSGQRIGLLLDTWLRAPAIIRASRGRLLIIFRFLEGWNTGVRPCVSTSVPYIFI
jgi:hypothetical protein